MTVPVDARLRGGRAAASLLHLRFEVVPQRDRVIVLRIMSAVDQRYITLTRRFEQWLERGGIPVELGKIPAAKLLPLLRIVPEPAPQRVTGRRLFHPGPQRQGLFLHSTRPQALHQKAGAVVRCGRLIGAFQSNHFKRILLRSKYSMKSRPVRQTLGLAKNAGMACMVALVLTASAPGAALRAGVA